MWSMPACKQGCYSHQLEMEYRARRTFFATCSEGQVWKSLTCPDKILLVLTLSCVKKKEKMENWPHYSFLATCPTGQGRNICACPDLILLV